MTTSKAQYLHKDLAVTACRFDGRRLSKVIKKSKPTATKNRRNSNKNPLKSPRGSFKQRLLIDSGANLIALRPDHKHRAAGLTPFQAEVTTAHGGEPMDTRGQGPDTGPRPRPSQTAQAQARVTGPDPRPITRAQTLGPCHSPGVFSDSLVVHLLLSESLGTVPIV